MDKPDVDFIEGLSPAVSIDQKSTNRNPRSTVGTITEVYDYLRLLFARIGVAALSRLRSSRSPGRPRSRSSTRLARAAGAHPVPGARARRPGSARGSSSTCSPSCRRRAILPGAGRRRGRSGSTEPPTLEKQEKHTIEVVVDRLVAKGADSAPSSGSPTRSRPRCGWPADWSSSTSSIVPDGRTPPASGRLQRADGVPQRSSLRSTSSSRARSPSTPRSAPARSARAWGPSSRSTRSSSSPTRTSPSPRARWRRGRQRVGSSDYFQRVLTALAEEMSSSRWTRRGAPCPNGPRTPALRAQPQGARQVPQPVWP
jgi:excinuclease ABC subunit A